MFSPYTTGGNFCGTPGKLDIYTARTNSTFFVWIPLMARMKNRRSSGKHSESLSFSRDETRPQHSGRGKNGGKGKGGSSDVWIYGLHAVAAALMNPARTPKRLIVTQDAADAMGGNIEDTPHAIVPQIAERRDIETVLPFGAVHQGAAMQCPPLADAHIDDIPDAPNDGGPTPKRQVVIALDQVTDPHNVGAVLRSAAAFGALAVIVPDRNSPEETGTIAKSACGALETVPVIRVTNLSRTLENLKEKGFWCMGLDGTAQKKLSEQDLPERLVLVMGAEGAGLRRMSKEHCDFMAKLPIRPAMESLNVSNALAITLYELLT